MNNVSLKDIAARAGVSFQTVSKVLKGKGSVSPETRAEILQIAEQLGYVPNAVAQSLVRKHTGTIGIVASDFSDYVLAQLVVAAEREARRQGQCAIVGSIAQDGSDIERYIHLLLERRVDGILLAASQCEQNPNIATLLRGPLPVVSTFHVPGGSFVTVGSSNTTVGLLATQHLLTLGHRRIGMITGPSWRRATQSRLRGYQRALAEANIPYDPALVEESDWEVEGGYAATMRLLKRVPDLTALFVQNDMMAIGTLSALHEQGVRVPQDCAVVGCDDIPLAAHTIPPLTTIHLPYYETGETAMRLLLDIVSGRVTEPERILLPVYLVNRMSSGDNGIAPR